MRVKGVNSKDVFLTTYQDHLNKFYISTAYKGFAVYQLNYDSLALVKDMPMQASIKCFNEQPDSTLWIGSTAGLIKFNKYSLKQEQLITTNQGLSNQYIYGVVADLNYLWLSTNAGINRYDVKNKTIKIFTPGDGLQSNEFNTYSFYKTTRGEILFGGVNGLNSFYPAEIKSNSLAPQLILTGLQVNDVAYQPGINQSEINKLLLEHNQNTVGFQFTVIHYANAAGNSLSYTLQGYDKSWVTVANKTLIRYANLPPGNFTLKVKAFNADGIESETSYSLPITIMAPWWKRWWFNLITALLLTGLAFLTARNYINRRLEKQRMELEKKQAVEKERNRISRDMHDDLGSGLTKIAILSEVVKKQLAEPEKAKEQLEKIAVSSRELVDNLQDIIWVLNPKNDNLESLSSYIREYALHYFEPFGIQVNFKYLDHFLTDPLSEEQRRNIFLTVKESFNNIAKHAWCNTVTVAIEEIDKAILISIEDDGKGFNVTGVRPFANGLKNMQNRIELVGGTYTIGSSLGQGTITQIKLPV
jgi:signal transduction histidine kinase